MTLQPFLFKLNLEIVSFSNLKKEEEEDILKKGLDMK